MLIGARRLPKLGLEVDVLDEAAMEELGMGALLGVGQGSRRESRMVVMNWKGEAVKLLWHLWARA